jgi:hypothetical protein
VAFVSPVQASNKRDSCARFEKKLEMSVHVEAHPNAAPALSHSAPETSYYPE